MASPCGCGKVPVGGEAFNRSRHCTRCYHYATRADYRAFWDEKLAITPEKPRPRPVSEWPRAARAVARFRRPGEKGVGDTLARLIGHVGGEAFKRIYVRITGTDCGCGQRQEKLNLFYPYAP